MRLTWHSSSASLGLRQITSNFCYAKHVIGNCSAAMLKAGRKALMQHEVDVYVNNEDSLSNVEQWIKDAVADMFETVYEREGNEGELIVIARHSKGSAEQQTDNSGSTKSLCLTCKSGDICDSRSYIQTKILACKRYRAQ